MSKYIKLDDAIHNINLEVVGRKEYTGDMKANLFFALDDLPTIEVMEYPQVEGITPTLVTTEVSEDCISKAYLEQEIENQAMTVEKDKEYWRGWNNALDKVVKLIEDAPNVVPIRAEFEWVIDEPPSTGHGAIYTCPFCGHEEFEPTNLCPACGAKMKGAEK